MEFDDPHTSHTPPDERGGLTIFLIIFGLFLALRVATVCMIFSSAMTVRNDYYLYAQRNPQMSQLQCVSVAVFCVTIAQLICVAGLWNFKRWGYQGLIGLLIVSGLMSLVNNNLSQAIGSVVFLTVLYLLVNPISQILE